MCSGLIRAGLAGGCSTGGAASFKSAFVRAENFIIGSGISSSELSLREYVRACDSTGTESARDKCDLEDCLYICLEGGRREGNAKWEEPIGVGDAIAIARAKDNNLLGLVLDDGLPRRIV
jgi:hypothetical protein